ncbi:MAG: nucleotidyltransferase domain-containing protein [Anaerolineales bacterium]|nr:nucleotidyltransferase domain-containing protein [Anaerolineae bacterium]MCB9129560.1 nucleotidyltransferase domain-containing protein [Anaerolineales bacterium]HRX02124.1 nucleotidyltransferase domain-containing protein [Anaerolineae bacterium]
MNIENALAEFRLAIQGIYGSRLQDVVLFGSWARGEATPDSDIDLAVILSGSISPGEEIDRMIDVITDLNLKYGVLISVYPVSNKDYLGLDSPLLMNVRREGVRV